MKALAWAQFTAGMLGLGLSIALMVRSELGLGPWDAFHVGLHTLTGVTIGTASILAGLAVVCIAWFFGERPGAGTLANMLMIGLFTDAILPIVPPISHWAAGLAYYALALVLAGVCTGVYISAGVGKGPRDGFTIALSHRTGWSVSRVRTAIELLVLVLGWSMGGKVGVGTVLFSLLIGHSMQWGLHLFGLVPRAGLGLPAVTPLEEEGQPA